MSKILAFLWACVSYVAARFIYGPLSRLYRFFFEKKYNKLPKNLPWSVTQVMEFYKQCNLKSDALGGVLDIISKPERFYEEKTGDCDEFAIFGCRVIRHASYMASITWFDPKKPWFRKFNGHNVCIYPHVGGWYHIGNWGKFGPFNSLKDVCKSIPPKHAILGAYSIRHLDLKHIAGGLLH